MPMKESVWNWDVLVRMKPRTWAIDYLYELTNFFVSSSGWIRVRYMEVELGCIIELELFGLKCSVIISKLPVIR
jgi:hypothetical protein